MDNSTYPGSEAVPCSYRTWYGQYILLCAGCNRCDGCWATKLAWTLPIYLLPEASSPVRALLVVFTMCTRSAMPGTARRHLRFERLKDCLGGEVSIWKS